MTVVIRTLNFHPKSDPKLKCTCGHVDCDERSVERWVLDNVQKIRTDLGKSMIITGGGRCGNHPNEVRKKFAGDHQLCMAVDVACDNEQLATKLKVLAGRYGATRVAGGWEDGFVHMAWTKTDRTDVPTWSYR